MAQVVGTRQAAIVAPDLLSPTFKANPHPFYQRLRHEAPVFPVTVHVPDKRRAWLVTRYADALNVVRDPRLVKNRRAAVGGEHARPAWVPGFVKPLERNMLDLDPPDHTRLRALVQKAFMPRLIEGLRERIQGLCNELLDAAERKGSFDLVADYALPIPATIIAELLGVPVADRDKFHRWSTRVVSSSSPRSFLVAIPSLWLFMRYMRTLIDRRRAAPRDDLVSALVQTEEAGDQLSEDELLAMVFILLIAGHETTVNLISCGTLELLNDREQFDRLRTDQTKTRAPVEELLRFCSPVEIATERYAAEDIDLHGVAIPRGDVVLVVVGSANRDEDQFATPDRIDLGREPNPHLALGQGIHYCLGAPLARLEGEIAFATLARRVPELRLAQPREAVPWRRGLFLRGPRQLIVAAH